MMTVKYRPSGSLIRLRQAARIMRFHKLIRRPLKVGVHTPHVLMQK
jgi:hypothetical protein